MFKKMLTASAFILVSSFAHGGSITSWQCEYTLLTNKTAIKLTVDSSLSSSATMTADNASPSGTYTITGNTVTNSYSGEMACGNTAFVVTDNSTTYTE